MKVKTNRAHVFVATLTGGGSVSVSTSEAIEALERKLVRELDQGFSWLRLGSTGVDRARNIAVAEARRSQATHLLFWDQDVVARPEDVAVALFSPFDVVGLPYPKKTLHWARIYAACKHMAELEAAGKPVPPPEVLAYVASPYVGTALEPLTLSRHGGRRWLRAIELGTGCLIIKMAALNEYIRERETDLAYRTDYLPYVDTHHAVFLSELDPDPAVPKAERRYLTEDYAFTRAWTRSGREAWMMLDARTGHVGRHVFELDLRAWDTPVERTMSQGGTTSLAQPGTGTDPAP